MIFFRAKHFFVHLCKSVNEHGIHSPFLYSLYVCYIKHSALNFKNPSIEQLRNRLKQDFQLINFTDYGAKGNAHVPKQKRVSTLAHHSLLPTKYATLLAALVCRFQPIKIMELGSSLGITTAYLSTNAPANSNIYAFEGDRECINISKWLHGLLGLTNIDYIQGNFDESLPAFLKRYNQKLDFIFIDGNHTYEATIRYFNSVKTCLHAYSVVVIDDIYWSKDMYRAWKLICNNTKTTLCLDFYRLGIVFFNPHLSKQYIHIRF